MTECIQTFKGTINSVDKQTKWDLFEGKEKSIVYAKNETKMSELR